MPSLPAVLVCCNRAADLRGTPAHAVRENYITALTGIAKALPLLMPMTGDPLHPRAALKRVEGILLTGSVTHLHPTRYGAGKEFPDDELDITRDETVLPLIEAALEADLPVLGICRGFQELNVVCGGTLHQHVHTLPGRHDHRKLADLTFAENLHRRAHAVHTKSGGLFEKWGLPDAFTVNSLHMQGVNRLGKGLHIEAVSDDGLVEAVSLPGKRFVVGTQWHPEGDCAISPPSARVIEEFGKALRG